VQRRTTAISHGIGCKHVGQPEGGPARGGKQVHIREKCGVGDLAALQAHLGIVGNGGAVAPNAAGAVPGNFLAEEHGFDGGGVEFQIGGQQVIDAGEDGDAVFGFVVGGAGGVWFDDCYEPDTKPGGL